MLDEERLNVQLFLPQLLQNLVLIQEQLVILEKQKDYSNDMLIDLQLEWI
jgi:hypothetical protein